MGFPKHKFSYGPRSNPSEIDLNAIVNLSRLPYFEVPDLKLKVLIDTGATDSIITPHAAAKFSQNNFFNEPFTIKSLTRTYSNNFNLRYPILKQFGINIPINFRVIDWHSQYDALLSSRDLFQFESNIDYPTKTLTINSIPINFKIFNPTTTKIPVSIPDGNILLPSIFNQKNEIAIPQSIHTATNGYVTVPYIDINFHRVVSVQPLENFDIGHIPHDKTAFDLDSLRLDHLNSEEKENITKLCKEYSDIFYRDNQLLSATTQIKHNIPTTDEVPVYSRSFRHPPTMQKQIASQIQKLLDNEIIRPSVSPYSSPVWIVPKKVDATGKRKYRLVIDYRNLNAKTTEDKYPLPRIDEILDNLGRCTYFSCLDLAQGFHQIPMSEESISKTAFSVPNGHFEYIRMPFGLKNGPATFQRMMDEILKSHIYKRCFVYMDDVIVFSRSLQDHMQDLKLIFSSLRSANLKVQPDKSEFLTKKVEFLGHIVTDKGLQPNPKKIAAIVNYPIPKTIKEIKSFLGLVGYYRRFIPNFAKIVYPINKCTRKGEKINIHDPRYISAFEHCKNLITNSPILQYPDFNKPFTLTTDASDIAIGSVLSQNAKPVAFYSRTLNSAERNYSTIEKELLAIVASTKFFRPYLFGQKFKVETDHNPLVWLNSLKTPNSRLIRWKIKLDEFEYTISYKKGKENVVADALSRVQINTHDTESDNESVMVNVDLDEIVTVHAPADFDPQEPESIISGKSTVHSQNENISSGLPISEECINKFKNQILIRIGSLYSHSIINRFNKNIHLITLTPNDLERQLLSLIKYIIDPQKTYYVYLYDKPLRSILEKLLSSLFNTSLKVNLCLLKVEDIVDIQSQSDLINEYHKSNHNGINETYEHMRRKYYWPNMKDFITSIINKCEICLTSKYERNPLKTPFKGPLLPSLPFKTLHADIFSYSKHKFLTIIDPFTKYAQAYYVENTTSINILSKLRHYFAHHNYPKQIVFDQGVEFKNKTVKEFFDLHKIDIHYTCRSNSSSNSPIERLHSTIIEKLRVLEPENNIIERMISAITIYNQSIHSATGFSPFSLIYGPYEHEAQFDNNLTIYEQYNQNRKNEILPFIEQVYNKTKQKADTRLDKMNETRTDDPKINADTPVYVSRARRCKHEKPYRKEVVISQDLENSDIIHTKNEKTKIETKNNVRKIKRPRK